jgi:type I restriction enzyme S subunit
VVGLVVDERISTPEFAEYFFRTARADIKRFAPATAQANINLDILRQIEMPLPPFNEQRRIVAKLEALQARSRRAREALDAVPPLLEKLRQSILAAAFRGDLTKDWRAKQKDLEPATELLKRISTARRQKWESTELAKLKSKGKPPADDQWKAKYKEAEPADVTGLPELPAGWCWATSSELSTDIVDCPHSTPSYGAGACFAVDTTCIIPGALVLERLRRVDDQTFAARNARLIPIRGDVVFAREGTVGTAVSLPDTPAVCLGQRVMLLRPSSLLSERWLEQALMSPSTISQYRRRLVGSTVPHLNVSDVVRLAIPLPPSREQELILGRLAQGLRALHASRTLVEDARRMSERLSTSILAKAFRGELVPQDPNDEPAETMLARARSANPLAPANGTPQKRGRPRSSQRADQPND